MITSSALYAQDNLDARRNQIIQIVNQELSEVKRLSEQRKGRDPNLVLRMAELNLEKARLWREKENGDFLKLPEDQRRRLNKQAFFKRSSAYYNEANKLCLYIARRFKSYKRMGEVYYILGFNAKEANNDKLATKYLSRANRSAISAETKIKSEISLAEVLYNQAKYTQAIPLYERALSKNSDKWWTKDSFNLAWSYYRNGQYSKAISKMEEVHQKSKSSKFIDMRSQVERDIGLFYATSGKIEQGIKFYNSVGTDFTGRLLEISVALRTQGQYTRAEKVLNYALKYEKNDKNKVAIYIEMLLLYDKYNKTESHLSVSKNLLTAYRKKWLTKEQYTSFKYQLEKKAAFIQRQAISKTYRRLKNQREQKAKQALAYFDILSELAPEKDFEYYFLGAETAFATFMYIEAYPLYKKAFQVSVKKNNNTFKAKSMDGMLAVLSKGKGQSYEERVFVFESYLAHWKRTDKSVTIYKRLFKNYLDAKDYTKAKGVLDRFVQDYPNDYKTQEAMISNLMEVSRNNKDYAQIRLWIKDIDAGKYKISRKYKNKLQELLTTIQIKDIEAQNARGNKKEALIGYHQILKDPFATERSKKVAMYNLAVFYYELGDTDKSYLWSQKALEQMDDKDAINFSESFVSIANFLFTNLEFEKSAALSRSFLAKTCKVRTPRKELAFQNSVFTFLADHNTQGAEETILLGRKCGVSASAIDLAEYELMKEYKEKRNWPRYEAYALNLKNKKEYAAKMIDEMILLEKIHRKFNNTAKINLFSKYKWQLYQKVGKGRKRDSVSQIALNHFAGVSLGKMNAIVARINLVKLEFPEDRYNKSVQSKLGLLTQLTEEAKEAQKVGSGRGIINSFEILYRAHTSVAKEIEDFTPQGKSKEYIEGFKKQMKDLSSKIATAGLDYKREGLSTIVKNDIFHSDNFMFQPPISNLPMPVQYFGREKSLLMDRGGKL